MKKKFFILGAMFAIAQGALAQTYQVPVSEADEPMEQGTFKPTWESLENNYKVPDWFKNAKFGIWAHWGPQCVEGTGDWMARSMYIEGSENINIMLSIMVIHLNLDSRTCCRCSRQKNGIQINWLPSIRRLVLNISLL